MLDDFEVNFAYASVYASAEIRALGIIGKIVTGPFRRIVGNEDNILAINPYIKQMSLVLSAWRNNASPLFSGKVLFQKESELDYEDNLVKEDELYDELFKDSGDNDFDVMTIQPLENICHAILIILEPQAADHLPGGDHYRPSEQTKASASNVPAHNKASESDFAILDMLIRMKPSANIETLEMITMWYRNKTGDWLHGKTPKEKIILMKDAMAKVEKAKARLKGKKELLQKRKGEILVEKQEKTCAAERKKKLRSRLQ